MNSESVHYIHIRSNLPDQSSYSNTLSSAQSLPLTMINIDMIRGDIPCRCEDYVTRQGFRYTRREDIAHAVWLIPKLL